MAHIKPKELNMKYLIQVTNDISNITYSLYREGNFPILLVYHQYSNGEELSFTLKTKRNIIGLFENLIYTYPQYLKEFSEMMDIVSELNERDY